MESGSGACTGWSNVFVARADGVQWTVKVLAMLQIFQWVDFFLIESNAPVDSALGEWFPDISWLRQFTEARRAYKRSSPGKGSGGPTHILSRRNGGRFRSRLG